MIEKNPIRYKTPDELQGQLEREKKYNMRAERNIITGGGGGGGTRNGSHRAYTGGGQDALDK